MADQQISRGFPVTDKEIDVTGLTGLISSYSRVDNFWNACPFFQVNFIHSDNFNPDTTRFFWGREDNYEIYLRALSYRKIHDSNVKAYRYSLLLIPEAVCKTITNEILDTSGLAMAACNTSFVTGTNIILPVSLGSGYQQDLDRDTTEEEEQETDQTSQDANSGEQVVVDVGTFILETRKLIYFEKGFTDENLFLYCSSNTTVGIISKTFKELFAEGAISSNSLSDKYDKDLNFDISYSNQKHYNRHLEAMSFYNYRNYKQITELYFNKFIIMRSDSGKYIPFRLYTFKYLKCSDTTFAGDSDTFLCIKKMYDSKLKSLQYSYWFARREE